MSVMGVVVAFVVAAAIGGVVFWVRKAISNEVALNQRDAALRVEKQRVDAMEAAAAEGRKARAEEFDRKNEKVRTARDAADLLRDQFN